MTRLKSLYVKDFRSIDGEVNLSFDAPIVLIHGPNGAGKTSLLSAIELALTGSVPSLSRAEPDYLTFLPHKDRPFGEVRLEIADEVGATRTADIRVTAEGITGAPLLARDQADYFSERSYLAQSTLGRLLEIYQHSEKKADSPLTRFVKELLGLDRMEALIGGLHSAGNIARLKAPVPAYGNARDEIAAKDSEFNNLLLDEVQVESAIKTQETALREQLLAIDPSLVEQLGDLSALRAQLEQDPDEERLLNLVRLKRELDVSQASWANANAAPGAAQRAAIETENSAARAALETWTKTQGNDLEALFNRAADLFPDLSDTSAPGNVDRADIFARRISPETTHIAASLDSHDQTLVQRDALVRQRDEARTRLRRLDEQIALAAEANEGLARALSDLGSHVHGDICPVCDRDFSETGPRSLAAHIAAKVGAMVEQAGRLQSLSRDRTNSATALAQLERELADATNSLLPDADISRLKARHANLVEIGKELDARRDLMVEGDALRSEAARTARALVVGQNADQSAVVLRNSLDDIARRVGVAVKGDDPTDDLIARIAEAISARDAGLSARQQSRRVAVDSLLALGNARDGKATARRALAATEAELAILRAQKAEADRMIEVAKDLVRQTREARGRVVRRVFNDELNAVWRDLFVRLAPEEPFIPAFAIPAGPGADIEAILETHHRRGGKGGNPRAMLSAGNLNTAALTLFLALHLSSKQKLPMLVIDDPVQSMDEVHIAQFAALLRTLSKQMKRQVVIAVHERSLFDYLCLELSPAFEGDRLNVIELGRNAIGQTISRWDPKLFVADRAIAA
ncbi:AAA family ATPase [Sphingobium sp. H39-3-25]|uniref:RecF/RecN/SMC N-terminal domain-containing protein n=1 Tax=Sphingopyxis fribergensis TaxID=1515612 RepID=A0A0A7PD27_9SPHN|nr:AAA family ATPase [Sphingopyxis fribergensis]AJA07088.1 hypothetical protein SKP52_00730 [Sphingopyxis fribergensis]MDF0545737.1 AAA family ATPase [Sphingobium arseniciresistens]